MAADSREGWHGISCSADACPGQSCGAPWRLAISLTVISLLLSAGKLLSFGRPTYGRLGQQEAPVDLDAACPEPTPVDGLEGVNVAGASAGLAVSGELIVGGGATLQGLVAGMRILCMDLS